MGGTQKSDLPRRRSAGNWQLYAAVTSSAMAMATGATAAVIAGDTLGTDDSVLQTRANPTGSQNLAILRAAGLATARTRPNTTQTVPTTGAPSITPGGIVPLYSTVNTIQPGEWVSIYGANLASGTEIWSGDFPQTLAGTSVTINGKPAFLMYVSPTQINLQAPDDTATGSVSVVVTTSTGSVTAGVTLSQYSPSFSVAEPDGVQFVTGIIASIEWFRRVRRRYVRYPRTHRQDPGLSNGCRESGRCGCVVRCRPRPHHSFCPGRTGIFRRGPDR